MCCWFIFINYHQIVESCFLFTSLWNWETKVYCYSLLFVSYYLFRQEPTVKTINVNIHHAKGTLPHPDSIVKYAKFIKMIKWEITKDTKVKVVKNKNSNRNLWKRILNFYHSNPRNLSRNEILKVFPLRKEGKRKKKLTKQKLWHTGRDLKWNRQKQNFKNDNGNSDKLTKEKFEALVQDRRQRDRPWRTWKKQEEI